MSDAPVEASASASPSFAQHTPTAPCATCCCASQASLCVFACGRSASPRAFTAACMREVAEHPWTVNEHVRGAQVGVISRAFYLRQDAARSPGKRAAEIA